MYVGSRLSYASSVTVRAVRWGLLGLAVGLALGGCQGDAADEGEPTGSLVVGDLEVVDAWVRAAPADGNTAAYMVIRNNGSEDDRFLDAGAEVARLVQVHETQMEAGVARMQHLPDGIVVPAGSSVALAPGGLHVMLIGLHQDVVEGEILNVNLSFEKAGRATIAAPVRAADMGGMEMDSGGG